MEIKRFRRAGKWFVGAVVASALLLAGCSGDNPVDPAESGSYNLVSPEDQVQFNDRVASVGEATRTLTFVTAAVTAIAAEDCEIVRIVAGEENVVEFGDIVVGDSVRVCGQSQEDGSVLAHRIRIYCDGDCVNFDVAFRGTITDINYTEQTFTVDSRSETILVDENTVIWGTFGPIYATYEIDPAGGGNNGAHRSKDVHDTLFVLTDLAVGFVVEVKANIENTEELRAVSIKVAGESFERCVTFEAYLSSVDIAERIVTFDGYDWIGWVCPGAILADEGGGELILGDFGAGDYVAVKGFPLEGDTLKVCAMSIAEP